jgi:hypothetical protein
MASTPSANQATRPVQHESSKNLFYSSASRRRRDISFRNEGIGWCKSTKCGQPVIFYTSEPTKLSFTTAKRLGLPHRMGGPAVLWEDGSKEWFQDGLIHRDYDQPAFTRPDGTRAWYQHGKNHRLGGPAWITCDGGLRWRQHGLLHREGAPAWIDADGSYEWRLHGEIHRTDGGPAQRCIDRGAISLSWCRRDELHRQPIDGPAWILRWLDGSGRDEYWFNGSLYEEQGAAIIRRYGTGRKTKQYFLCETPVTQKAWREQMTDQWGKQDLVSDLVPGDYWNEYLLDQSWVVGETPKENE